MEARRDRARTARAARRRQAAPAAGDLHLVPHGLHLGRPGGARPRGGADEGVRAGAADGPDAKSIGRVYESNDSGAVKADKLAARLETLEPGLWLHIDHAATNDPEIQAMGHVGYEWVAADRSANLEMWTSPKVREVITRRGITLTSYRDLQK